MRCRLKNDSHVRTSAVFTNLRRSNGEVFLLKAVADSFLDLIKSDERIIAEQTRIILELKAQFEEFAAEITRHHGAASQPTDSRGSESDS